MARRGFPEHLADAGEVQQLHISQILDAFQNVEELRAVEAIPALLRAGEMRPTFCQRQRSMG